jgi:hypothetical protein
VVDVRIILSGLWVALMLTYLLGDVLRVFAGDMTPGEIAGVEATQGLFLRRFTHNQADHVVGCFDVAIEPRNQGNPCCGGCRMDDLRGGGFGVSGWGRVGPGSGFRWRRQTVRAQRSDASSPIGMTPPTGAGR